MRRVPLLLSLLLPLPFAHCTCDSPSPLAEMGAQMRAEKMGRDGASVRRLVTGLERFMRRARAQGIYDIAGAPAEAVKHRTKVRRFFAAYIDYALALDTVRQFYTPRGDLSADERAEAFLLAFTADMALYINTAELLRDSAGRREFEVLLDEGSPEDGVPKAAWSFVKSAFTRHPWQRPLILANAYHQTLKGRYRDSGVAQRHPWLLGYVEQNWNRVLHLGVVGSPKIAVREWADLIAEGFQRVWFPAQKGVAEWMGDTKVRRNHTSLISDDQIKELHGLLEPGDILIERRNWYLSNVGLPGFWPHAALYLGTPDELRQTLGQDTLDSLRSAHPAAFASWETGRDANKVMRVIEAVSEGVVFTSLEHSASADYVAALRPRLPPEAVAAAIDRSFGYFGRPYDFEFDFLTDATLVCTELVYKAFEAPAGKRGLSFDLIELLGRPTLPANDLVRQFDREYSESWRQMDFVAFLDGREREGDAVFSDLETFRASHRRPKWDFLQR